MKAKLFAMLTVVFTFLMSVTAFATTPPANPIEELAKSMTTEMSGILPHLAGAAATVIGAVAPIALTIAGMIAVFGLTIGIFRKMTGR
jgi:hypothetical protein